MYHPPKTEEDKENLQSDLGLLTQPASGAGGGGGEQYYGGPRDGYESMEDGTENEEEEEDMDEKEDISYSATYVSIRYP
jgi:hypothetical protein